MTRRAVVFALSFLTAVAVFRASHAESSDLSFKEIRGAESGLEKIMKDWKDMEFKRQNGNFKSHGWWVWGLTAFDIDNDGDVDLVPTHHGLSGGLILKSDFSASGKLTFRNVTTEMGIDSRDLPTADGKTTPWDFDGDGFLDLPGWSDESKPRSFHNLGGKKLVPIKKFTFHPVSHPKEDWVRDLNGDGYLDFAGKFRGRHFLKVYDSKAKTFVPFKGNGHKKTSPKVPQAFLDHFAELKKLKHPKRGYLLNRFLRVTYLTEYDLNLDGKKDLIAKCSTSYGVHLPAGYFLGDGEGNYTDKTAELGLPNTGSPSLIRDVTGDGLPDIFVVRKEGAGFYMATVKGKFVKPENKDLTAMLKMGGSYIQRFKPVDLDNDGDFDLVISLPREGIEEVYENKGKGSFKRILKFSGWDSDPIAICDLNNDGLLDIAVGGSGTRAKRSSKKSADITLFINRSQKGNYCNIYPRMDKPNPYAVGTKLTVYPAGRLGTEGALPIVSEFAHKDASPVHVGLGDASAFDLRVVFPNGKSYDLKNVSASNRMKVTPDGKITGID